MGEPHWVRRFTERRAPGAYTRVLQAGVLCAGDPILTMPAPAHDVTVAALLPPAEPGALERLLAAERSGAVELAERVRATAMKAVGG
jgi:MOSC domain-containing protein YiiM